jgi:hypothetical protein
LNISQGYVEFRVGSFFKNFVNTKNTKRNILSLGVENQEMVVYMYRTILEGIGEDLGGDFTFTVVRDASNIVVSKRGNG